MRTTVLSGAIALLALSAYAVEAEKPKQTDAQQQTAKPAEQTLTPTAAPQQQTDSRLVSAAKRTGRLGKKPSIVITNDTLVKSGGHFTTTESQASIPAAPAAANKPYTPPPAPAAAKKAPSAEKVKDAAARRAMADYMEESIETISEDPAAQEGVVSATAPKPAAAPKPAQPPAAANKPPSE